jgi:hypothetical protein
MDKIIQLVRESPSGLDGNTYDANYFGYHGRFTIDGGKVRIDGHIIFVGATIKTFSMMRFTLADALSFPFTGNNGIMCPLCGRICGDGSGTLRVELCEVCFGETRRRARGLYARAWLVGELAALPRELIAAIYLMMADLDISKKITGR